MVSSVAVDAFAASMFTRMANHIAVSSCTTMGLLGVVLGSTDATDRGIMAHSGPMAE